MSLVWGPASSDENASDLRPRRIAASACETRHAPEGIWAQVFDSIALDVAEKFRWVKAQLQRSKRLRRTLGGDFRELA